MTSVLSDNSGSLSVALHPTVLVTIADSYSRYRVFSKKDNVKIIGILLGTQNGNEIAIKDAFEMPLQEPEDGCSYEFDFQFFKKKKEMIDKVPSFSYTFLGWYCNGPLTSITDGNGLDKSHMTFHQKIIDTTGHENPLFLLMDTSDTVKENKNQLPIDIYETSLEQIDGVPRTLFAKNKYQIKSELSERISVDFVAHAASDVNEQSKVSSHFKTQKFAVEMLYSRVQVLLDYITEVLEGRIQPNPEILREIATFCNQMPVTDSPNFTSEFQKDYTNVQLIAFFACLTKGCALLTGLQSKAEQLS